MSVALTVAQMWSPGWRASSSRASCGDLGDERDVAGEADADAVGLAVDVGDGGRPDVAWAAVGWGPVEGDGVGLDDGERVAVDGVGGDDAGAGGRGDAAVVPAAAEEVDADEVGDVAGAWSGGDVGEGAGLDDVAVFEDDDAVGEGVGVDGVVGDEEADAVERGEVAAEVAADVAAGAGVEGGEGFVEEQQAWLGGEGAGQGDALRLSAGQGAWPVVGVVGQPDTFEPRHGPAAGVGSWGCCGRVARRRRSRAR